MSKGGQPRIQKTPLAKCSQIPEIRNLGISTTFLYSIVIHGRFGYHNIYDISFSFICFFLEMFMLISHSRHYKAGIENFLSAQIMVI